MTGVSSAVRAACVIISLRFTQGERSSVRLDLKRPRDFGISYTPLFKTLIFTIILSGT